MDIEISKRVYGIVSYLLQYPDDAWNDWLYVVRLEADSFADPELKRCLIDFLDEAERVDKMNWQNGYVQTFDFGKKTNLYLTYSAHGEERERGSALIELKRQYAEAGFDLAGSELPDYLPLVLEFASAAPWPAAAAILTKHRHALVSIRRELAQTESPYAALFDLLLQITPEADSAAGDATGREVH